jgi:sugar lactone lactonase YvrE
MLHTSKAVTISLCILLAACGGGDGSSTTPGTPNTNSSGLNQSGTSPGTGSDTSGNSTAPADTSGSTNSSGSTGNGAGTPADGAATTPSGTQDAAFKVDESARFNAPGDLAFDSTGNLYVLDTGNQTIRRIAPTGEVSTLPGTYDGARSMARDNAGNLFLLTQTEVIKVTPDGNRVTLASYEVNPAALMGISTDAQGNVYVLLTYGRGYTIEQIAPDNSRYPVYYFNVFGGLIDFASSASGDLAAAATDVGKAAGGILLAPKSAQPALLDTSPGITLRSLALDDDGQMVYDTAGNLYIANIRISINQGTPMTFSASGMRLMKMTPDGNVSTILNGFPDGSTAARTVTSPRYRTGLAVGPNGDIYMADSLDNAIYRISPSGQAILFAGKPGESGSAD